ncbi:MAG: CinA family protein [Clostridia bacterium]|nr:CinA family protein [Clostridia bacterium]
MGLAKKVVEHLAKKGLTVATAESCTGGMVAATIISVPGSSVVMDSSYVTYSNKAKTEILGVPEEDINLNGAVSEIVARKMAQGACRVADANVGVAATGIAGPGGGTIDKPVGLVYIAVATEKRVICKKLLLKGSRNRVRRKTTKEILKLILEETK